MPISLTKYEQETIINFNAGEKTAIIYTADKGVIKNDMLVIEYSKVYKCIKETDISKTYEVPNKYISYSKPRKLSEKQRERARNRMRNINESNACVK